MRWMVLNAQDVGLAEGISSGMGERSVDQERAGKQSEWEIEFGGGDDVTFERDCGWWRKFLSGSYPGIEWAAGDGGLVMRFFLGGGIGGTFFVMAAVHIGHGTGVRLNE